MYTTGCSASGQDYMGDRQVAYNASTGLPVEYRCERNTTFCTGGLAGPALYFWACPASYQINAMPNPDGTLCFADLASCTMSGANSCLGDLLPVCKNLSALGSTCYGVAGYPFSSCAAR